eukprot:4720584-Prymnesium_polylepis.1
MASARRCSSSCSRLCSPVTSSSASAATSVSGQRRLHGLLCSTLQSCRLGLRGVRLWHRPCGARAS